LDSKLLDLFFEKFVTTAVSDFFYILKNLKTSTAVAQKIMELYQTPWKLASFGELELLRSLHDKGVKFEEQDERGFTPLTWAGSFEYFKKIKHALF
jgi:hypothetical protein